MYIMYYLVNKTINKQHKNNTLFIIVILVANSLIMEETKDNYCKPIKKRRRYFVSKLIRPITKTWILRKITNAILYGFYHKEFVLDTKKIIETQIPPFKKRILLPSYTRNSQEWNFYYFNTTTPYNLYFFLFIKIMFYQINCYHISKFNALKRMLGYLNKKIGPNYETHREYENLMDRVCKMQKYYWTLRRFVMHCQYKRAKIQIENDLYMNPLVANDKNTFVLLQEGKLFYFTLNNISKIIVNALTHHSMFFMQPQIIKNPYNNVDLKISDLYNIYFKMKFNEFPMSYIFSRFYYANFDINMFKLKYEHELKTYAIRSYADNATTNELIEYALEMISMIDTEKIWDFDEDFPDDIIVRELRPFIRTYLFYSYSLEYSISYKLYLKEKLQPIIHGNPYFGKKRIQSRFIQKVEFYDKIQYTDNDKNCSDNFLKGHKYCERGFTIMQNELNLRNTNGYERLMEAFVRTRRPTYSTRDMERGYLTDSEIVVENSQSNSSEEDEPDEVYSKDSSVDESDEGDDYSAGDDETTVGWNEVPQENTWKYIENNDDTDTDTDADADTNYTTDDDNYEVDSIS